jgi:aminocarboxymuconate-semialdehyde decarboxylase
MVEVIDVHTHMYMKPWLDLIREKGGPDYTVGDNMDSNMMIYCKGASFAPLEPPHFDYELRIKNMDNEGVDVAILSMPGPSAFWGPEEVSLEAAQITNDDFSSAQVQYPDRIRWMAALPWEYPNAAIKELKRAHELGAIGVLTLGNINGRHLTDPLFRPIWQAVDDLALPVLLHPTAPPGVEELQMSEFAMIGSIGFMVDTSVAVVRMIGAGFFDEYPNLKLIAAHAGATLPYLAGRLDRVYDTTKRAKVNISQPPTEYLKKIYYDSVCYTEDALDMCLRVGGENNVLYGSDYPFNYGDMKGILARVDNQEARIRDKIRSQNTRRIFKI